MILRKMKILDFHKISYILVSIDTVIVGVAGFEPATSCSQSRRDDRATLHPELFMNRDLDAMKRRDWDSNPGIQKG